MIELLNQKSIENHLELFEIIAPEVTNQNLECYNESSLESALKNIPKDIWMEYFEKLKILKAREN